MKINKKWLFLTACLALAFPLICSFAGNAMAETAACVTSACHGNTALAKTISGTDPVPLYVDIAAYNATAHGTAGTDPTAVECDSCHTDIVLSGGTHAANVDKTFGGWARFSPGQNVESIPAGTTRTTRNYYSPAVTASCAACHTDQAPAATGAHATIYKLRGAHIDTGLTTYAIDHGYSGDLSSGAVGENYAVGNCNRCHAGCQSCHFNSTVVQKNTYSVKQFWDEIQATDKYTPPLGSPISVPDSMSEYYMDWTTNVGSHNFRNKTYFETDADGVCEACHIGFNRPSKNAFYWQDEAHTIPGVVKAVRVKRHPQAAELKISGDAGLSAISPLTSGTNTAHAAMECADCHGTAFGGSGNVHSLPGTEPGIDDPWATRGDVHCTDCHNAAQAPTGVHTTPAVAAHIDGTGKKVACIGCHTFGLARDFEIANTGSSTSHEVFLDPETNEVRPVVWKNAEAIAWYSHNWQTLNTAENPDSCAQKCHYEGNLVDAGGTTMAHPTGAGTPTTCTTCHITQYVSDLDVDDSCGQCHGGSGGVGATTPGAPYMSETALVSYASVMHGGVPEGGPVSPDDVLPPTSGCDGSLATTGTVIAITTNSQTPVNCGVDPVTLLDTCNIGAPGQISVGAAASQAADAFIWWGDGAGLEDSAVSHTFSHTYNNIGRFQVILTVKNACGFTAQKVMIVNVTGGDNGKGTIALSNTGSTVVSYNVKKHNDPVSITSGEMPRNILLDAGDGSTTGCYDVVVGLPSGLVLPGTPGVCSGPTAAACLRDADCPTVFGVQETCSVNPTAPTCTMSSSDTGATCTTDVGCSNVCLTAGATVTVTAACP